MRRVTVLDVIQCVLWLAYPLTFLFPRKRGIWLFGADRDKFADNPKYLFLYVVKNHPEICAYWVTGSSTTYETLRKLRLPVLRRWSAKGLYYALRAHIYFFSCHASDVNFGLSGGAVHVNLWHGVGIKQIEFGITSGPSRRRMRGSILNRILHPERFRRPDYLLSTTDFMSTHFARSFRVPMNSCLEYGYPRTDIFFDDEFRSYCFRLADYWRILELLKGHRRIFLLAPTYRDSGEAYLDAAKLDLRALDRTLGAHDSFLVVNFHQLEAEQINREDFSGLKNIILWPSDLDVYPMLPEFDVLITDYSSLYYDFILLRRPAIIYAFDMQEFVRKSRSFALDFAENVAGDIATSEEELRSLLVRELTVNPRTEELVMRFWGSYCGKSCERIFGKMVHLVVR